MKNVYIKPEVEVLIIETQSQMMSASNFNPESGDSYDDNFAGANKRRGTWGNLWAEE